VRVTRPRCAAASQSPSQATSKRKRVSAVTLLHAAEAFLFLGLVAFSAILPPLFCLEWLLLLRISEAAVVISAMCVPLAFAPALALRAVAAARRAALARAFRARDAAGASDAALAAHKSSLAALSRRAAEASQAAPAVSRTSALVLCAAASSAAVLRAAAGAAAWAPPLALACLGGVLAFAPLPAPPLWFRDAFGARELRLAATLETEAYAALHRGTHHCAWRADLYPAATKAVSVAKLLTNELFAAAVSDALRDAATPPRTAHALVLDAATGITCDALERSAGLRLSAIFSPNTATPSVAALLSRGVRAFFVDVGALLRARPASWEPYDAVWLDYCSGFASRSADVAALFGAHALADGGVLGLGFSHRDAGAALEAREGLRADAHAERVVRREAGRRGYGVTRVARHDYDGMCFLAFRVTLGGDAAASPDGEDEQAAETWGAAGGDSS